MRSCEWIRICERMKIGVKNMEAAAERMGRITMIDGPVVRASGLSRFAMGEMMEVGELALGPRGFAALCAHHCSTCVALGVRAMMT